MHNTQKSKGTFKTAKLKPITKSPQHTPGGKPQSSAYKGSNLNKNKAPGHAHSSLYKGSNLKKNTSKGYSQSSLYTGNTLNVGAMTSVTKGGKI